MMAVILSGCMGGTDGSQTASGSGQPKVIQADFTTDDYRCTDQLLSGYLDTRNALKKYTEGSGDEGHARTLCKNFMKSSVSNCQVTCSALSESTATFFCPRRDGQIWSVTDSEAEKVTTGCKNLQAIGQTREFGDNNNGARDDI